VYPIEDGYRVTLSYNLFYDNFSETEQNILTCNKDLFVGFPAKKFIILIFSGLVVQFLKNCKNDEENIKYVGYILEHEYSEDTLTPEQLKGRDKNLYLLFKNSQLEIKLKTAEINFEGGIKDEYRGGSEEDNDLENFSTTCILNEKLKDVITEKYHTTEIKISYGASCSVKVRGEDDDDEEDENNAKQTGSVRFVVNFIFFVFSRQLIIFL
jgi:hypothetical protein